MDKVVEQSLMDIPGGRVSSIGKGWQSWPATFFSSVHIQVHGV